MSPPSRAEHPSAPAVRTRIVLLAGPSGSGKSSLAAHVGLPTLCLDDFYKDGDDPSLPLDEELGIPDWDHPASWDAAAALEALVTLVTDGIADVPVYDIPTNRSTVHRRVTADGAPLVVAEGIFAAELVTPCRDAGILADALCLTHRPTVTFWRRLVRDLREGRKPPLTLLRRGWALLRAEPAVVARQIELGAVPVGGDDARRRLARLRHETATVTDDLAA
jgi:uridine kinase